MPDFPDVRRALPDDQSAVGDLWEALLHEQADQDDRMGVGEDARERWDNDFPVWIEDETRRLYVAEREGQVVGFTSARRWGPAPVYRNDPEVFLDEIYVASEARRQGLGTQLWSAVQHWSDQVGAHRVRLQVLATNDAARAFWAAQEATPLTLTLTVERPAAEEEETDDEGSKKIGF